MRRSPKTLLLPTLLLSLTLGACVASKAPLLGPDGRVLPFASPAKLEYYERPKSGEPWAKRGIMSMVADASLVVRELDNDGKPKPSPTYTFHPLGPQRFLAQANFGGDVPYAYGLLEIRDGEGFLVALDCKQIDQQAFRAGGGTVTLAKGIGEVESCWLDGASNPLELLRSVVARPAGGEFRYVPVR